MTAAWALHDGKHEFSLSSWHGWQNLNVFNVYGDPHTHLWPPVYNATQEKWYWTIQDAIDNAGNGDQIVVPPRVYPETVDFDGKSIVL